MNYSFKVLLLFTLSVCSVAPCYSAETRVINDMTGRQVEVPVVVDRVLCSGPGCLRYLTYIQGQNLVVGVDSIEKRLNRFDARPYALANPQFREKPLFGDFRGHDNPELILGLKEQPQVIFKTFKNMGYDADELQKKTGIPVVCLSYANLVFGRQVIYDSLMLMGDIIGKKERATEICTFIEKNINDLEQRAAGIPKSTQYSVYIGGIAKKGPHGFQSTEPGYPPFYFVNAINVASSSGKKNNPLQHANVSREQIVSWNPDILFVDLASTQLGTNAGAVYELRTDPAYQSLAAVREGNVYGVLPYNWYTMNYGSIIANAYFIGKVLYPERFTDIDPQIKADEIYTFMVGKPVLSLMDRFFGGLVFKPVPLD